MIGLGAEFGPVGAVPFRREDAMFRCPTALAFNLQSQSLGARPCRLTVPGDTTHVSNAARARVAASGEQKRRDDETRDYPLQSGPSRPAARRPIEQRQAGKRSITLIVHSCEEIRAELYALGGRRGRRQGSDDSRIVAGSKGWQQPVTIRVAAMLRFPKIGNPEALE